MDTITESVIEKSEEKLSNLTVKLGCEDVFGLDFSDPWVLIAIEKFNLKTFNSIVFLEYQAPVNGSRPNECDVAWRFRNKKEKSWRKYWVFRRFGIGYSENCT